MSLAALYDFAFTYDVENKYIVKNPSVLYSVIAVYVIFVKWIGPALMENRKAFELRNILIFYNFFQAIGNTFIAYEIISGLIEFWDERCMVKYNPELPKLIQRALKPAWLLFLVKHIDLLDTVFFVLRKKQSQITFLHVFHHAGMCLISIWGITRLHMTPGYYIPIGFAINTVIHVIMYTYYGLAAIGPNMRKYLWWKKYLTIIQIFYNYCNESELFAHAYDESSVAFVCLAFTLLNDYVKMTLRSSRVKFFYQTQIFFIGIYLFVGILTGCEELGNVEILAFSYIVLNFVLFLNFYRKYKKE